jgi:hypothetical protein
MTEACQTKCRALEFCKNLGESSGIVDYNDIAREAAQSCMALVVGEVADCYIAAESAQLISFNPDLLRPDYPDVRRYA